MKCMHCGRENPVTAKFCKNCGNDLKSTAGVNHQRNNEEPQWKVIRYCKKCNKPIKGNSEYCSDCRNAMNAGGMNPRKSNFPTIIATIIMAVVIIVGIFLAYCYATDSFIFKDNGVAVNQKPTEPQEPGVAEEPEDDLDSEPEEDITDSVPEDDILALAQSYRPDAISYDGHAYAIVNFKDEGLSSYTGCERYCENMGGHLAVINSEDENRFLYQFVQESGLVLAFFGYSDQEVEGHWRWVKGMESNYTNWASGQPNNGKKNKRPDRENYAEFFKDTQDGTWNDAIFGKNTHYFICEWE